jgi:hypothetical protein
MAEAEFCDSRSEGQPVNKTKERSDSSLAAREDEPHRMYRRDEDGNGIQYLDQPAW